MTAMPPVIIENVSTRRLVLRIRGIFVSIEPKTKLTVEHVEYLGSDVMRYAQDNRLTVRQADRRILTWAPVAFRVADAPEPPPSIADPTLWVGAWITNGLSSPNLIATAPGSTMSVAAGTLEQGDGNTSVGFPTNTNAVHIATPNVAITDFTLAAFMRGTGTGTDTPYLVMGDENFTTNYFLFHTFNQALQVSGTYGTPAPVSLPGIWIRDAVMRHYAFVYTAATMTFRCFRDGALFATPSVPYDLFGGVTPAKIGLSLNSAHGYFKNPILTREVLTDAAVAALAAGHMPNSAGILV